MWLFVWIVGLNCVLLSGICAQQPPRGWRTVIYDWRTIGSAQTAAVNLGVEYESLIISYERIAFISDPGREEYRVIFLAKCHNTQLKQCQADVLWQFVPKFKRTVSKGSCQPYHVPYQVY